MGENRKSARVQLTHALGVCESSVSTHLTHLTSHQQRAIVRCPHKPPRVAAVKSVLDAKPAVTLQFSLLLSLSTIVGNMPVKLEM